MSKLKSSPAKAKSHATERYANGVPQTFVDRDLRKINPMKEQFEPLPGEAVRQHYKMAGGC